MSIKLSTAFAESIASAASFVGTMAGCHMILFEGAQPANANLAHTGPLCTILLNGTDPLEFNILTDGEFEDDGGWYGAGTADGIARSFLICKTTDTGLTSDGTQIRLSGTVTEVGGGGDVTVLSANVLTGRQVSVASFGFAVLRG